MTKDQFEKWLEEYLKPQEKRSAEKIKELFAEDGVYWYGPYFEPRKGVDAIYDHHRNALSHQEQINYKWKVLAITDEYGIAWFDLTLKDIQPGEPGAYQGIFKIHINDQNKCTLFEEWYNFTS